MKNVALSTLNVFININDLEWSRRSYKVTPRVCPCLLWDITFEICNGRSCSNIKSGTEFTRHAKKHFILTKTCFMMQTTKLLTRRFDIFEPISGITLTTLNKILISLLRPRSLFTHHQFINWLSSMFFSRSIPKCRMMIKSVCILFYVRNHWPAT